MFLLQLVSKGGFINLQVKSKVLDVIKCTKHLFIAATAFLSSLSPVAIDCVPIPDRVLSNRR